MYLIYSFFFFLLFSRHLPEKVKDDIQLKNMSGQWFYEAKSKRHRDKIHGADIIRASMRRKPATLGKHLVYVLFWKGWLLCNKPQTLFSVKYKYNIGISTSRKLQFSMSFTVC